MMKSPFQFVQKPPPTTSKIVPNEDKTKHIFVKDKDKLPRLEPIPPTVSNDIYEAPTEPFDLSKYIDHPEYIDEPNPFSDQAIPLDEPKFYEKPTVDIDLQDDDDNIWQVATTKRKRKSKKSFLSKAFPATATSPSPSNSSPSSQSQSSSTARPTKDFRYAGSG
jgi:hypothetical protein